MIQYFLSHTRDARRVIVFLAVFSSTFWVFGQNPADLFGPTTDLNLRLEAGEIQDFGGLQSYAVGTHDGKWLLIGGRLDGLHQKQPWATFDAEGRNPDLVVIDPKTGKSWRGSTRKLPKELSEQLKSTNMEFTQVGQKLYLAGGYGYSRFEDEHTTFGRLIEIDLPAVIGSILDGKDPKGGMRFVEDEQFAVTGGRMHYLDEVFYLVGGHKFHGKYNPMGADHGPGFVQAYTEEVRRFRVVDDAKELVVEFLPAFRDTAELHRRDFNVVPQIFPDGSSGFTAFSGVFQKEMDVPFQNAVDIRHDGVTVNDQFSQFYNHYHCPFIPLYSSSKKEMHTLFLGGIAQFYEGEDGLVHHNDVPFVKTISRVTRNRDGKVQEFRLKTEMPAFLGAAAEFIPAAGLPVFENGVIDLDQLDGDEVLLGYVLGGIESSGENIFWDNEGDLSSPMKGFFKVYLPLNDPTPNELNEQCETRLKPEIYVNPYDGVAVVYVNTDGPALVNIIFEDERALGVFDGHLQVSEKGRHRFEKVMDGLKGERTYLVTIYDDRESIVRKVVIIP